MTDEYLAYLDSPEWKAKRQIVLARADNRCQLCNSTLKLQVHHRCYDNLKKDGEIQDLVVLCERCHTIVTVQIQGKKLKNNKKFKKAKNECPIIPITSNGDYIVLTRPLVELLRTDRGGFTSETMIALGLRKPRKGWVNRLVGKRIKESQYCIAKDGARNRKQNPFKPVEQSLLEINQSKISDQEQKRLQERMTELRANRRRRVL
jgi:hypothetical protein